MPADHPLDQPVWSALTTRQAHLALGGPLARRFPADMSPLCAAEPTAEGWTALTRLVEPGEELSLMERAPPPAPPGIEATIAGACVQMVAARVAAGGKTPPLLPLGDADAADMLALAQLTRPGPFRARTHTLGRFLGVRIDGRLAAMAGERVRLDGFVEVSGVCTHPDFRGRGLSAALTRAVCARILSEGDTPFLHAYESNTPAVTLYRQLGFELRRGMQHVVWRKAG